jgi:hypothetical protein
MMANKTHSLKLMGVAFLHDESILLAFFSLTRTNKKLSLPSCPG